MTRPEFKVWTAKATEEDATDLLNCIDAEQAAEAYIEDLVREEPHLIDGDPIEVHVRSEAGVLTKWSVRASMSVDVFADELEEP